MNEFFLEDPFGAHRIVADQIVSHLLEAWTPEREAEIVQKMKERGAVLVERVVLGDYDLVLWHYAAAALYAVSVNSGQEDPSTLLGQERQPKAQRLQWQRVQSQLHAWVKRYGKLLIGSTVSARTQQYRRLLQRNFLIGEWRPYPEAGFFILPD